MVNLKNMCPVCGYEMDDPPRDYNVCPSCGTEFGLHDANAAISELRASWLSSGPTWWSTTDPQPANWEPLEQARRVINPIAGEIDFSVSVPPASGSMIFINEVVPVTLPAPGDISHAEEHWYTPVR